MGGGGLIQRKARNEERWYKGLTVQVENELKWSI